MSTPTDRPAAVVRFLAELRHHPHVLTEQVLGRSLSGRQNPYQWLARAVSSRAGRVLDVGCGAGRLSVELEQPGRLVVGLDISRPVLQVAAGRAAGPWVQADATRLPFADASLDAVTTSMGLAVVSPPSELLAEVARVLKPGGVFAAITPTVGPLRRSDVVRMAKLTRLLRSSPRFPSPLELTMGSLLGAAGLTRAEDRRERYAFQVRDESDARELIGLMYLPDVGEAELAAAVAVLTEGSEPVEIGVPIRRVVAVK